MPNCDWNRPCNCIECRTIHEKIICPKCQFSNIVEIVRKVAGYSYDKKGLGGYDFEIPQGKKDLTCYNCSFLIKDVNYFTKLSEDACQRKKEINEQKSQGFYCRVCQKTEKEMWGSLSKLYKQESNYICHDCLYKEMQNSDKNPSNEKEKYFLDCESLEWKLTKIQISCLGCQRKRWLLPNNAWKKYCSSCYFKQNQRTFSTFRSFPRKINNTLLVVVPPKSVVYYPQVNTVYNSMLVGITRIALLLVKRK